MKLKRLSVIAVAAAAGALALVTTVTASNPAVAKRPFLTTARTPQVIEHAWALNARAMPTYTRGVTRVNFPAVGSNRVRIVVRSDGVRATEAAVAAAGGKVERTWRNLVQAVVPWTAVAALRQERSVDLVRAPMHAIPDAVGGEEVGTSLAAAWHAKGFTGKGVKVAIIDAGFKGLTDRQAAGELPADLVTQDFCGGEFGTEEDHGTAVAEIVHEMAPDAQLYLLCVGTEVDLAAAEAFAKAQGVSVISHSLGWAGPFRGDGTGPVGAVVADARAAGILWVNSAGNEARTHWSGTFSDSDGNRWHEFAPNDMGNSFIWPNESGICGFLRWDEWPAGVSDFDLVLGLSGPNVVLAASAGYQTGSQPPFEGLCRYNATGIDLQVFWAIGGYRVTTNPRLDLVSWSPSLQYQVAAGSIADPATSPAAFAVGALCWQSRQPEFYSSQGPTIDGRMKPDIAAHDSVSSATYGGFSSCVMSGFAGTSAAAPEVAGAAALVKQVFPSYTPDQLQQYLQKAARDIGEPGADNVTGAGELQMPKPPDLVAPSAKAQASSGRAGKMVKLLSSVADDEGRVSVVEQVKRNGRVIATLRRPGMVSASSPKAVTTAWKAPAKPKGSYQHCVVATDAAGNKSAESCAKVSLR